MFSFNIDNQQSQKYENSCCRYLARQCTQQNLYNNTYKYKYQIKNMSAIKAKNEIVDNKNNSVRTIFEQQFNKIMDHKVSKVESNIIDQYQLQKPNQFTNKDHNKQIPNQMAKQAIQLVRKPKIIRVIPKNQRFFKSVECIKFIQQHQKKPKPEQQPKQLGQKIVSQGGDQRQQNYLKQQILQQIKKKTEKPYQIAHEKTHQKKSQIYKWKDNFPSTSQQIVAKNIQHNQQSNQQKFELSEYYQPLKKQQTNKQHETRNNELKQYNKQYPSQNQQAQNLKKRIYQIEQQNKVLAQKISISKYFAISEIMDIEQQRYIVREIKDYLNLLSSELKDFRVSLLYRWDKYNIDFFKYIIHANNKYNLLMVVETVNNKKIAIIFKRFCKNSSQCAKMVLYSLTKRLNYNQQYEQNAVSFDRFNTYLLFGNQIRFANQSNKFKLFLGNIGKKCFNINNSTYLIEEDIKETEFQKMQIYKIMI